MIVYAAIDRHARMQPFASIASTGAARRPLCRGRGKVANLAHSPKSSKPERRACIAVPRTASRQSRDGNQRQRNLRETSNDTCLRELSHATPLCHGLTTASTTTRTMVRSIMSAQHMYLRVSFCSAFALVSALLPWFTNSFAFDTCGRRGASVQ